MNKFPLWLPFILILLSFSLSIFIIVKDDNYAPGKVSLYSHDGTLIKEYVGKIEHIRRYNGFKFTVNGRHVITKGVTAIFEEGEAEVK